MNAPKSQALHKALSLCSTDDLLQVGGLHVSCKKEAEEILAAHGKPEFAHEYLATLGRSALEMFCARTLIEVPGIDAAEASICARSLHKQITSAIGEAALAERFFKFGPQVSASEKRSLRQELALRLIGAWAFFRGFAACESQLVLQAVGEQPVRLPSAKDAKTLLQEFVQARGMRRPEYELLGKEGPENDAIFTVRVTAMRWSESGCGRSKKQAELEAALTLISRHLPDLIESGGPVVTCEKSDLSRLQAPTPVHRLAVVADLIRDWGLPDSAAALLQLAHVHRSAAADKGVFGTRLGKDNRLLAFYGSTVLQYSCARLVLATASAEAIRAAGGIGAVAANVVAEEHLSRAYVARTASEMIVARGQEGLTSIGRMRAEVAQAIVGAIALATEPAERDPAIPRRIEDEIRGRISQACEAGPGAMPAKTHLQELCQALSIGIRYDSVRNRFHGAWHTKCAVSLSSAHCRTLHVSLPTQAESHHELTSIKSREARLASLIMGIASSAIGRIGRPDNLHRHKPIASWFLEHVSKLIEHIAATQNLRAADRLVSLELFGWRALQSADFGSYLAWVETTSSKGANLHENLREMFYRAGPGSAVRAGQKDVKALLERTLMRVAEVDPLSPACSAAAVPEYEEISAAATLFRLLNASVQTVRLETLESTLPLLYRSKRVRLACHALAGAELEERAGSLLAVVDCLVARVSCQRTEVELNLRVQGDWLSISVATGTADSAEDISNDRHLSTLRLLFPASSVFATGASVVVRLRLRWTDSERLAVENWWAYQTGAALEMSTSGILATQLHDMKNELSAMFLAASSARDSTANSKRYLLAHTAATHADEVRSRIHAAQALLAHAGAVSSRAFDIASFFRDLSAQILGWLPSGIAFLLPIESSSAELQSDPDKLRSIVLNLVRNSVAAMPHGGGLRVTYAVDTPRLGLKLVVADSGPGLTADQLRTLASGMGLDSTKRSGPGVGLMSVLLLTRDLGGTVQFLNLDPCGLSVEIFIPSAVDREEVQPATLMGAQEEVMLNESSVG